MNQIVKWSRISKCVHVVYGCPQAGEADELKLMEEACKMTNKRKRERLWQCLNAICSLVSLAIFISILLGLFLIFHNVDNKPWTSIFTRYF